jgi:multiple sugar transport system permease protein
MRSKKSTERLETAVTYSILFTVLLVAIFPIIWMFLASFKKDIDIISMPPVWIFTPTIQNYEHVFSDPGSHMVRYFMNSVIIAIGTTVLAILLGTLAAYSLARFKFRGDRLFFNSILVARMVPSESLFIPLFLLIRDLGLLDTHLALIIVYLVFNLPFTIWMMRGFFEDLPLDIEESAMVDGCSRLGAFRKVALPLVKPGLVATSVLCIVISWNEFLFALIISFQQANTVPLGLSSFLWFSRISWGQMYAASSAAVLPIIIFVMAIQKYLVRGLTLGAVKG